MEKAIIGTGAAAPPPWDPSTPHSLRQATQEFESIFIAQMMKEMRSTVPHSDLLGSESGEGMFREMLDQELSRRIAGTGGFGIGDLLYQQLAAQQSSPGPTKHEEHRSSSHESG